MSTEDPKGYGNPPKSSQFQKGTSGNPQGRPKGTRNIKSIIMDEMNSSITNKNGEVITKRELLARSLVHKSLQGNARDLHRIYELLTQLDKEKATEQMMNELMESLEDSELNDEAFDAYHTAIIDQIQDRLTETKNAFFLLTEENEQLQSGQKTLNDMTAEEWTNKCNKVALRWTLIEHELIAAQKALYKAANYQEPSPTLPASKREKQAEKVLKISEAMHLEALKRENGWTGDVMAEKSWKNKCNELTEALFLFVRYSQTENEKTDA